MLKNERAIRRQCFLLLATIWLRKSRPKAAVGLERITIGHCITDRTTLSKMIIIFNGVEVK
ncbi:hypothetical protein CXP33_22205 [Enterobacter cloacae complex sp. TREC1]|nr:hypothetical protein CXP33_22205 [Enterobacter cloacae complex sp. TREC1]